MRAGPAKAAQVHDLVAFDDGERYARHLQTAHLLFDVSVDRVKGSILGDRLCRSALSKEPAGYGKHGTDTQRSDKELLHVHRLSFLCLA